MKCGRRFFLLIASFFAFICCNGKREFNKATYLKECGISPFELVELSDSTEEALSKEVMWTPMHSDLLSYRYDFLYKNDIQSCSSLLCGLANKVFYTKKDSILRDNHYSVGLSKTDEAKNVISLTLSYAKKLTFDKKERVGITSFPFAKRINDTLAAQSVFRIIEGIIGPNKDSVTKEAAHDIVKWCRIGQPYAASAFKDSPKNYSFLLENLVLYSWQIKDPQWQVYADSLVSYKKKLNKTEYSLDGPIYDRYLRALEDKDYTKAGSILQLYRRDFNNIDSTYIPLHLYLNERPHRREEGAKYNRDLFWNMYHTLIGHRLNPASKYYIEKARLCYLQEDTNYSKWLNRAFYQGVSQAFPSTALEYIDYFLHTDYKYNEDLINLLAYQYNNNDPKSVYDALLFIKGASETIPISIYKDIKQYAPQNIVNYVDSIRLFNIESRDGRERDYLENHIGISIKASLKNRIISYFDVQNSLKPNSIAIEYYAVPSLNTSRGIEYRAALLCSDSKVPIIVSLCSDSDIRDLIQSDKLYSTDKAYKLIWFPFEKYLTNKTTVYFSMDRLLNFCNLPALMTTQGHRLKDSFVFKQLTSTSEILTISDTITTKSIALFGGMEYEKGDHRSHFSRDNEVNRDIEREGYGYLPASLNEVEKIDEIACRHGIRSLLHTGTNGTEAAVRALSGKETSIIHLATHGFYYNLTEAEIDGYTTRIKHADNALNRCGIILSNGQSSWLSGIDQYDNSNGILLGSEIANLDFSGTDLVVLSACNTGLGDISNEGIAGLQQAFKRAGVTTLLLSLKPINDDATKLFMVEFYEHLFNGESLQASFNAARNRLKSHPKYSSPDYWAAYILLS